MNRGTRFRQLLAQPAYRTKLAFFLILGIAIFLLSALLRSVSAFWSDLLLEFAVVFDAAALIQFLWDFLGGDPMEIRIRDIQGDIAHARGIIDSRLSNTLDDLSAELSALKQSMHLLADLMDTNIGIERIWPDRRSWQLDSTDGVEKWETRVCQAKHVDIMSRTLWQSWMRPEEFRQRLFSRIAGGAVVRILIYDPDSEIVELTARDEEDPGMGREMRQEIRSTLLRLAQRRDELDECDRSNLQIRLTTEYLHLAQIIRADNSMLVGIYLSGKSGTPSPTIQLRGPESTYFDKYAKQFEIMWNRGKPVDETRFSQILKEYSGLHPPRPED